MACAGPLTLLIAVARRYALFGILTGSVWGYLAVVALVRRYMRKRFYQARLAPTTASAVMRPLCNNWPETFA